MSERFARKRVELVFSSYEWGLINRVCTFNRMTPEELIRITIGDMLKTTVDTKLTAYVLRTSNKIAMTYWVRRVSGTWPSRFLSAYATGGTISAVDASGKTRTLNCSNVIDAEVVDETNKCVARFVPAHQSWDDPDGIINGIQASSKRTSRYSVRIQCLQRFVRRSTPYPNNSSKRDYRISGFYGIADAEEIPSDN